MNTEAIIEEMIGDLPKSLEIDGVSYKIDSDFRTALLIMQMYNDRALSPLTKQLTMLNILFTYIDEDGEAITNIPADTNKAIEKAMWFLDIGQASQQGEQEITKPTMDYKQDEQMLFSAVNDRAKKEIRAERYLHWWTFYGLCQAIDSDSQISIIIGIRNKLNKGIILETHEKNFYIENKHLIDIHSQEIEDEYENMADILLKEKEMLSSRR